MGSKNWTMKKASPSRLLGSPRREIKEQEAVAAATLAELQNSQKELDQLKYQMDYLLSSGLVRKPVASCQHAKLGSLEGWIENLPSGLIARLLARRFWFPRSY